MVETSYLCELYRVPGFSNDRFHRALVARLKREVEHGSRFHVTMGCVLQLCDHIADVKNGQQRRDLATRVTRDVETSSTEGAPWILRSPDVLQPLDAESLPRVMQAFRDNPSYLNLGLTKCDVIGAAKRLHSKYNMSEYRVHIWTRSEELKAHEPHPEGDPL